jgi:RHS repeat-associated protein
LSVTVKINGIQKGTNAYTYDILNRVTKLTQSGTGVTSKRVDMTYNAVNQLATLNRYGDLTGTSSVANTSYTYDLAGRLQTLTHQHGATTLASYGLTYDNANRIIQSSGTDGTQDYGYDSTNQLTTANHTTQTDEAYSYDANGNRTSGGSGTGTNNQLLTDGTYTYEYDGEGNRTKRTEIGTGKVTEYVWDYRNRLTSVLFKDASGAVTKSIEYTYDSSDRRIGKKIDGVTTERYVYDGSNIALVFDGTGTHTHRYLYGVGVDQVLADERGGTVVWALSDNQGTLRDLVDGNGTILNHIVYDSFGQVKSQSDASVEFRYGYTGRDRDTETGLDYYRARYYDAANGRFISEDPIGFSAGDSNLTRYVGNNAVNAVDPSGLQEMRWPLPNPIDILIFGGEAIKAGLDYAGKGGVFNPGGLSDGNVPNTNTRKTPTNPGEFDPNYGAKNKPTTSFSHIHIRTSGSEFKVPNKTTFPGTGTCSIGGKFPGLRPGHTTPPIDWFISHFNSIGGDLISPQKQGHILGGDATGGGHRPGAGKPGKSEFPQGWTDDDILNAIADVATDPNATWTQQEGSPGSRYTKKGLPVRWKVQGTRNGVDITVIVQPDGKGIITGFPTNTPKNPP